MIEDKIKELKELNNEVNSDDIISKRDDLILEIEKELMMLKDFYNWKEWKNEENKSTT